MKLNDIFLIEEQAERTRRLDFKSAVQIARRDYSECLKYPDPILYRGSKTYVDEENALLVDPTVGERKSLDSGFGYTELISFLPAWQNYPTRNKSLILSAHKPKAAVFGAPLPVLLPNNFKAVISSKDFWSAFSFVQQTLGFYGITRLDKAIYWLFESPNTYQEFLNEKIPSFVKKFNYIKNKNWDHLDNERADEINQMLGGSLTRIVTETGEGATYAGILFLDMYNKFDQLDKQKVLNYFNDLLDPEKNQITLTSSIAEVK